MFYGYYCILHFLVPGFRWTNISKERMFLNVVETGVLGKVFSLLAGPADSIRQNRELTLTHSQMTEENNLLLSYLLLD